MCNSNLVDNDEIVVRNYTIIKSIALNSQMLPPSVSHFKSEKKKNKKAEKEDNNTCFSLVATSR